MRDLGTLGSQGSQAWGINDPSAGAPTLACRLELRKCDSQHGAVASGVSASEMQRNSA